MDTEVLEQIGKIWLKDDFPKNIVEDDTYLVNQRQVMKSLESEKRRSVVITGDVGVGKTTLIDLVCRDLTKRNWTVFVASASQVMAGQKYIGELEQQVRNIISALKTKKNSLWVIPNFHETFYVGRTSLNPLGILDQILATVDKGEILILGETTGHQFEKVVSKKPVLRGAVAQMQIFPSDAEFTDQLATKWAQEHTKQKMWSNIDYAMMREIGALARQFLAKQEEPGILFQFLKSTTHYFENEPPKTGLEYKHFLESLSAITGFPEELLDDKQSLDLEHLKQSFNQRIIGQPEAVGQLTERIAMIKAGLTDPQKPLGVFLFVGPTGTGKTEVAKTLAAYLFGNEDRMIRFDMSELQTADDLIRMTGGYDSTSDAESLTSMVKKQPFSIILLDEFEKAHHRIWDLFLQVFDDGRLTDDQNGVVDFRNCIIILTSNTGASNTLPPRIGFGDSEDAKATLNRSINLTLQKVFRPEFLNRIDRIVHFNPLDASAVRKILKIELQKVLQRRGFRRRQWEVEWEDSALNLLMTHGYDPAMGARPMKRAIEQLVLAPLAITIVTNNFPEGDQFLFVSERDGQLKVDFVDPEEPKQNWKEKANKIKSQQMAAETMTLKQIINQPQGKLSEREVIIRDWKTLEDSVTNSALDKTKEKLMAHMAENGFWENEDRFDIMSDIEYLDRFQYSYTSLGSLMERIVGEEKTKLSYPANLLKSIAERLRLLKISHEAFKNDEMQDCFLEIKPTEVASNANETAQFLDRQKNLYYNWGKARRMQVRLIHDIQKNGNVVFWFGGFGARQILKNENGLHIWESPKENAKKEIKTKVNRYRFRVITYPVEGLSGDNKTLEEAFKALQVKTQSASEIIRTYKIGDKSLVKDHKSGWKTARLDFILKGNFDLM